MPPQVKSSIREKKRCASTVAYAEPRRSDIPVLLAKTRHGDGAPHHSTNRTTRQRWVRNVVIFALATAVDP